MEIFLEKYDNNNNYFEYINANNYISNNFYSFFTIKYLFGFTILNLFCYTILYNILLLNNIFIDLDYNKKLYIIKNINKSLFLAFILITGTRRLLDFVINDKYNMELIRYYGTIYVSCDFFALLVISKLPKTTKIHHLSTIILLSIVANYDANDSPVVKLICIYTMFSFFAFLVNFYLAIRFFEIDTTDTKNTIDTTDINVNKKLINIIINNIIDKIRILAYYNYLICCIFNWSIHIYLITSIAFNLNIDIMTIIYLVFLIPIIKDDLILMSWLRNKKNLY